MTPEEEAKAKQRFIVLGLLRLSGAVLIAVGMAVIAKGALGLPVVAGYALFAVGIADFILLPVVLAKRWKSPPAA
jgi:hypothetical protein